MPELSHTKSFRNQKEDAEKEVLPKDAGQEMASWGSGDRHRGWGGGGSQYPHPLWDQTGITLLSGTQKASPMVPVIVHLAFQQFLRTSCVQALPGH